MKKFSSADTLRRWLITMIDDGTNTRYARFFEGEPTAGAMEEFSCRINRYGIPQAKTNRHLPRPGDKVIIRIGPEGETTPD